MKEESQAMAAIVSGSTRSLDMLPPSERASSLQPHSSEEEPQVSGVGAAVQHRDEADFSIARVNMLIASFHV